MRKYRKDRQKSNSLFTKILYTHSQVFHIKHFSFPLIWTCKANNVKLKATKAGMYNISRKWRIKAIKYNVQSTKRMESVYRKFTIPFQRKCVIWWGIFPFPFTKCQADEELIRYKYIIITWENFNFRKLQKKIEENIRTFSCLTYLLSFESPSFTLDFLIRP